jgi:hypothetical protein
MQDPYDLVVAALEATGRTLDRYGMTRCPAHADSEPSLRVSRGDRHPVVLHCFAGCPIEHVLTALGLGLPDLFPKRRGPREGREGDGHVLGEEPLSPGAIREVRARVKAGAIRDGSIAPAPVSLGPMSDDASEDHHWLAITVQMDLMVMRGAGIPYPKPIPYSNRWCAEQMGWPGEPGREKAGQILRDLCAWGTFRETRLPPTKPGWPGTRALYEALPAEQVAPATEEVRAALPAEPGRVEPDIPGRVERHPEAADDVAMGGAEANDVREVSEGRDRL